MMIPKYELPESDDDTEDEKMTITTKTYPSINQND